MNEYSALPISSLALLAFGPTTKSVSADLAWGTALRTLLTSASVRPSKCCVFWAGVKKAISGYMVTSTADGMWDIKASKERDSAIYVRGVGTCTNGLKLI